MILTVSLLIAALVTTDLLVSWAKPPWLRIWVIFVYSVQVLLGIALSIQAFQEDGVIMTMIGVLGMVLVVCAGGRVLHELLQRGEPSGA